MNKKKITMPTMIDRCSAAEDAPGGDTRGCGDHEQQDGLEDFGDPVHGSIGTAGFVADPQTAFDADTDRDRDDDHRTDQDEREEAEHPRGRPGSALECGFFGQRGSVVAAAVAAAREHAGDEDPRGQRTERDREPLVVARLPVGPAAGVGPEPGGDDEPDPQRRSPQRAAGLGSGKRHDGVSTHVGSCGADRGRGGRHARASEFVSKR